MNLEAIILVCVLFPIVLGLITASLIAFFDGE